MEQPIPIKEVKILETAEDIQERREQVLNRYHEFKVAARLRREKLEDSRRFQYFRRDADELENWIYEKLQSASDESYKDPTNLQAKIQKHQAFEAEVAAHSNAIVVLDNTGIEMINQEHFQRVSIKQRLDELHRLWELLLSKLAEKGMRLQQALVLVQYLRQVDEVMFWISDKETFVTADEFGHDLEHVEVLQRKFDEFRVSDVCMTADRLYGEQHPESEIVIAKKTSCLRPGPGSRCWPPLGSRSCSEHTRYSASTGTLTRRCPGSRRRTPSSPATTSGRTWPASRPSSASTRA